MSAIQPDFHSTDHMECINCMDCQKNCPVQAIQFGFASKPAPSHLDISRRRLLGSGLTGILSLGLIKIGFTNSSNKGKIVRPPGAWDEPKFLDKCIRCGECIRICSTSGAGLHFSYLESGFEGLATPMLMTPTGYCEFNCNLCGQVCPTGAIHALQIDEKHQTKMGTAYFNKNRCIPWYYGENCMVCEEHCPVPEKAIKFREEKITTLDGRENQVFLPYVNESLCIGCGICTTVCPLIGDKGIFLTNDGETRWGV
jgi:ferredoxin